MTNNEILTELRFHESTTNLKNILSKVHGCMFSTRLTNDIGTCLQQGRLFYESAKVAPIEIRPLIIFYGMSNFSKAMSMAVTLTKQEAVPQKHGLRDISAHDSTLENLTLKFHPTGAFQAFNDATNFVVNRVVKEKGFFEEELHESKKYSSLSKEMTGKTISLKEILSRVIGSVHYYLKTFNKEAGLISCDHPRSDFDNDYHKIRVSAPGEEFKTLDDVQSCVQSLRNKYPFLKSWCLLSASWSSRPLGFERHLYFANIQKDNFDEFSKDFLKKSGSNYFAEEKKLITMPVIEEDLDNLLPPIDGNHILQTYEGILFSQISLYYLGMYLLGSLVRYRPNIWVHSITGRYSSQRPADDNMLALIEKFMDDSLQVFPRMVLKKITAPYSYK